MANIILIRYAVRSLYISTTVGKVFSCFLEKLFTRQFAMADEVKIRVGEELRGQYGDMPEGEPL